MQNDENWENEIDWSKRTAVVVTAPCGWLRPIGKQPSLAEREPSGPIFYEFIRTQAIPALDEGLRRLAENKAAGERKLQRWSAIADRAADLSECFASQIDLDDLPATVNGVTDALKVIIDVSRKMQGICRRAKKDIKRHGGRFWSKLDEWNAMRSAV